MRKGLTWLVAVFLSACTTSNTIAPSAVATTTSPSIVATPSQERLNPATTSFVAQLLAVDRTGHVYFSDCDAASVYRVDGPKHLTAIAGDGSLGFSGDGGPATAAELDCPAGLAFDRRGDLYIVDHINDRVRMVDLRGVITTFARGGFHNPWGITIDTAGAMYVADRDNNAVEMVNGRGVVSTVAGSIHPNFSGDGGRATDATMNNPLGVAVDALGNLFVADSNNNRVRKIDTHGIITTVAGTGKTGSSGDGGPATKATLNDPSGVAFDGNGNLFVMETGGDRIREIDTRGIITTVAGTGNVGYSGDGGPAWKAELNDPGGIAFDKRGDLYIADRGNACIRMVDPAGIIHTLICSG